MVRVVSGPGKTVNTLIPASQYHAIIEWLTLFTALSLAFWLVARRQTQPITAMPQAELLRFLGFAYLASFIVLIGLRPISYEFGDMGNYFKHFRAYQMGLPLQAGDYLFELFMFVSASFISANSFFLLKSRPAAYAKMDSRYLVFSVSRSDCLSPDSFRIEVAPARKPRRYESFSE